MWQKLIKTSEELAAWLEEHHWFEERYLLNMRADDADGRPRTITVELGEAIAGSYEANSEVTLKVFALTACGLKEWRLPEQLDFGIDTFLQSVEAEAVDEGVRILIDDDFMVHCAQLQVRQLPDRREIVPARPSDDAFYATVEDQHLPTPSDWVGWFGDHGEKVVWRMYGEPARPPDQVPEADYEGWFLQREDAVAATTGGLFIFHCRTRAPGFFLSVQKGEASEGLWTAMQQIIGGFSKVEVESGNCRFTGQEWLEYLR
jgi:hypothetical protein